MEPERPVASRKSLILGCALVGLAAIAVLWHHAERFKPNQLNIVALNDQVGYVTTARWLADTGELRSHIIYPAYVNNPKWRLYMPGHYWALAAVYKVFDYGPFQSRIPGLVSFVLSTILVFCIGRKLYGTAEGAVAAFLFLVFPPNVAYSYTAMSDPSWVAASLLAFFGFLHLPERTRYYWLPLLFVPAFLYRETALLMLIPIVVMGLREREHRWRKLAVACVGTVFVLWALGAWQTSTGRTSPPISWILRGEFNIADAVLEEAEGSVPIGAWIDAFQANLETNISMMLGRLSDESVATMEPIFTGVVLGLAVLALLIGMSRVDRDPFAIGSGLLGLAIVGVVLLFHRAVAHVVIRHILISFPFTAIAAASILVVPFGIGGSRPPNGTSSRVTAVAKVLVFAIPTLWFSDRGAGVIADHIVGEQPESTERFEDLKIDDTKLLICTPGLGLDYVLKHYPMRWSFVPENEETLELLCEKHDVGTFIVRKLDLETRFPARVLKRNGFYRQELFKSRFWLYVHKPDLAGEEPEPREDVDSASRFTRAEILDILDEGKDGVRLNDLYRKYGINGRTFQRWKLVYSDPEFGERTPLSVMAQRVKLLQDMIDELTDSINAVEYFTVEQILEILAQENDGVLPNDLILEHGITNHLLYAWRAKYGHIRGSKMSSYEYLRAESRELKQRILELEAAASRK